NVLNSTIWPDMDPADRDTVSHVLTSQEQKIQAHAHKNQLNAIATGVQQITERQDHFQQEVSAQVNQLNAQLQQISTRLGQLTSLQPTTPAAPPPVSTTPPATYLPRPAHLAPPEKYSRETTSRALFGLRQRSRRVIDYAIEFRTLAADSGWNSPAITGAFINGLNDDIKDQLAIPHETPAEFEDLVNLAIRINTRLRERESERRRATRRSSALQGVPSFRRERVAFVSFGVKSSVPSPPNTERTPSSGQEEPMQLGHAKLDPTKLNANAV
ncbi:hypothetical protein L3Q82_009078, partial [Scortum barcoo]